MSTLEAALHASFTRERPRLLALAHRITGSASEADDIVQEAFTRTWASPPPDHERALGPWLVRVTANLAKDALRRRRTRGYLGPWLPEVTPTREDELHDAGLGDAALDDAGLDASRARAALDPSGPEARYSLAESATLAFLVALEALTPRERVVVVLRDVLGLEASDTAHALETTEGNVRVVHHRARAKLRDYDAARVVPTRATRERCARALHALLEAIASGDEARVRALLAEDVRLVTDGGGEFHAAVVEVHGAARVAALEVRLARELVVRGVDFLLVNGLPAALFTFDPRHAKGAPRAVLTVELDSDGRIRVVRSILASRKLARLR